MSNKPYKGFEPKWLMTPAPAGSYRSIFRWGDPEFFKYPKESLYKMMKEAFHMTDEDFRDYTGAEKDRRGRICYHGGLRKTFGGLRLHRLRSSASAAQTDR